MSSVKNKIHGVKVDKVVDPSAHFDFPLLNDLEYANNIVEKYIGKKNFLNEYLGKGTFGYAWLNKNGNVYKFTKSYEEAAGALILSMFGDKLKTQATIYKIYEIVIGNERLFIIEKEYTKPVVKYLQDELNIRIFQTYKPAGIIENLLAAEYDDYETFEMAVLAAAEYEGNETEDEMKKLLSHNKKFMRSVFEFHKELKINEDETGMQLSDTHIGNIGVKNDRVVCFDCVESSKYILKHGGMVKNKIKGIKSRLSELPKKKTPEPKLEPKIGELGWDIIATAIWKKQLKDGKNKYDAYINSERFDYELTVYDANLPDKDSESIIDGGSFDSFDAAEKWLIENYQTGSSDKKQDGGKASDIVEIKFGRWSSGEKIMTFTLADFKELLNDIRRNFKSRLKDASRLNEIFNYGTLFPDYINFNFVINDINPVADGEKLKSIIEKYADKVNWSRGNIILYGGQIKKGKGEDWNVTVTMSPKLIDSQSNRILDERRTVHKFQDESPSIDEIIPGEIHLKDGGQILTDEQKAEIWYDTVDESDLDEVLRELGWKPYKFKNYTKRPEGEYPTWDKLSEKWENHDYGDELRKDLTDYVMKKYPGLKAIDKPDELLIALKYHESDIDDIIPGKLQLKDGGKVDTDQIDLSRIKDVVIKDGIPVESGLIWFSAVLENGKPMINYHISLGGENKKYVLSFKSAKKDDIEPIEFDELGEIKNILPTNLKWETIPTFGVSDADLKVHKKMYESALKQAKTEGEKELWRKRLVSLEKTARQRNFILQDGGEVEESIEIDTDELVNTYRRLLMEAASSMDADELFNYEQRIAEIRKAYSKITGENIDTIFEGEELFKNGGKAAFGQKMEELTSKESVDKFVDMLQQKINDYFEKTYPKSFASNQHPKVSVKEGGKYIRIDIGSSGSFMLDKSNNHLYYIKGYGVIDKKKDFGNIKDIVDNDFAFDGYSILSKHLADKGQRTSYGYAGPIVKDPSATVAPKMSSGGTDFENMPEVEIDEKMEWLIEKAMKWKGYDDAYVIAKMWGNRDSETSIDDVKEAIRIAKFRAMKDGGAMWKIADSSEDKKLFEEIINNQTEIDDKNASDKIKKINKIFGQKFSGKPFYVGNVNVARPAGIEIYNQPISKVESRRYRGAREIRLVYPDNAYQILSGGDPKYKSETINESPLSKGLEYQWWGMNGKYLIQNFDKKSSGATIYEIEMSFLKEPFLKKDGGLTKDKRYALTTDMYIYAPDDQAAVKQSQDYVNDLRDRLDNQAQIIEIVEAPFGSLKTRKLENVPKYQDGGKYSAGGKIADTEYIRVIPRDLFNESKLLKCIGRLILLIHDNNTPVPMSFHHDDEPFNIGLMDEGALTITNINIWINKKQFLFKTIYNSKSNYPLYVQDNNYTDYRVFNEKGEFETEFIEFCKTVK